MIFNIKFKYIGPENHVFEYCYHCFNSFAVSLSDVAIIVQKNSIKYKSQKNYDDKGWSVKFLQPLIFPLFLKRMHVPLRENSLKLLICMRNIHKLLLLYIEIDLPMLKSILIFFVVVVYMIIFRRHLVVIKAIDSSILCLSLFSLGYLYSLYKMLKLQIYFPQDQNFISWQPGRDPKN